MPVIGKLDTQVNDIMIAPLAKQNAERAEFHSNENETARSPQNAAIKLQDTPAETNNVTEAEKMFDERASLPVWLL